MLLSSANSIFEVGIGINLAFGAFKGMRDGLYNVFVELLKSESDTIQARLDGVTNGDGKSSIVLKTEDIRNDYSDLGRNITNVMVAVALFSACLLMYFLARSALNPNKSVQDWKIYPTLVLAAGPLIAAALSQLILYLIARFRLNRRLAPYRHYIDVSEEINPKTPTA